MPYVPRVLLCGNEDDFRKTIGDKPVEIVGRITFAQADDAIKFLSDNTAEYLIFTDAVEFELYLKNFPSNKRAMSAKSFAEKIHDGFFSYESLNDFYGIVRRKNVCGRLLDFDCYLAKNDFKTYGGVLVSRKIFSLQTCRFTKMFTGKFFARSTSAVTDFSTRYF